MPVLRVGDKKSSSPQDTWTQQLANDAEIKEDRGKISSMTLFFKSRPY
jgi:hypothetical protein